MARQRGRGGRGLRRSKSFQGSDTSHGTSHAAHSASHPPMRAVLAPLPRAPDKTRHFGRDERIPVQDQGQGREARGRRPGRGECTA